MKKIEVYVKKIINDVKENGDSAIKKYIKKFDGVDISLDKIRVSNKEINNLVKKIDRKVANCIEKAAKNIELFHKDEFKRINKNRIFNNNSIILGQKLIPVSSAGIYIPGGKYSYASTLLMGAIPAKIAGVKRIVVCTPPKNITPQIAFATKIAGVDELYRIGGTVAISAMTYGTESIKKVDFIAGPGNEYVTEAKRQVFGDVGIDMLAGPSEIAIICDKTAIPEFIAYDLLSQIEHDINSKAVLFCESGRWIEKISKIIRKELAVLVHLNQINFFNSSLEQSIKKINEIAPEHLQIIHSRSEYILSKIYNAGTILIGNYSPTALSDYFAGPSHILPTGATARFSSGLSVMTFLKRINIVRCSKSFLKKNSNEIIKFAEVEGLKFHSKSIGVRKEFF